MAQSKTVSMSKITIILVGCLCIYGCGNQTPTSVEKEEAEPGVIDYLTGAEHIKQYKKIKSKIEDINKSREERFNDF